MLLYQCCTLLREFVLRKWLIHHGYSIIAEHVVQERQIFYPILIVKKQLNLKLYRKIDLFFGKLNMVNDPKLSYAYLLNQKEFWKQQGNKNPQILNNNKQFIKLLDKMVKKYESKWNL